MLNSYTEIKYQDNHCVLLTLLISLSKVGWLLVGWLDGSWCIHFRDLPFSLNEINFVTPQKLFFYGRGKGFNSSFHIIYKNPEKLI